MNQVTKFAKAILIRILRFTATAEFDVASPTESFQKLKMSLLMTTLVCLALSTVGMSFEVNKEKGLEPGNYVGIFESVGFSLFCSAQIVTRIPLTDRFLIRDYECRIASDEMKAMHIRPEQGFIVHRKAIFPRKPSWIVVVDETGKEM